MVKPRRGLALQGAVEARVRRLEEDDRPLALERIERLEEIRAADAVRRDDVHRDDLRPRAGRLLNEIGADGEAVCEGRVV